MYPFIHRVEDIKATEDDSIYQMEILKEIKKIKQKYMHIKRPKEPSYSQDGRLHQLLKRTAMTSYHHVFR